MSNLVTVVIHSYNRYEYLSNAIKSVLNQTMDDYEIILINDESTDERYYKNNFGKKVSESSRLLVITSNGLQVSSSIK